MTEQLPSFKQGLPVTIVRWNETLAIEKSRVCIRRERAFWVKNQELPISEFRAVQIDGMVHHGYWEVRVELLHQFHPRKNLLLAERWWRPYDFTDEQVKPLRELCYDASCFLSLPMIDVCELKSFNQGLPVTMVYKKKSIIIERSRVCIRYHRPVRKMENWLNNGEWSSVRRDEELPISEFKAVQLELREMGDEDTIYEFSVTILHQSKRSKNVLLGWQSWSNEGISYRANEPLRKMWRDAAKALSLPAIEVDSRGWRKKIIRENEL